LRSMVSVCRIDDGKSESCPVRLLPVSAGCCLHCGERRCGLTMLADMG
jgi:hypothetical protein